MTGRVLTYPVERAAVGWSQGADFSEHSRIAFAFAHALQREAILFLLLDL